MNGGFPAVLSSLRKEKGLNQRSAAAALNISQALLSHYENGAREPGLEFVTSVCRYYNVSADYLLGISGSKSGSVFHQNSEGDNKLLRIISEEFSALLEIAGSDTDSSFKNTIIEYMLCSLYRAYLAVEHEPRRSQSALCDAKLKTLEAFLNDKAINICAEFRMPENLESAAGNVLRQMR